MTFVRLLVFWALWAIHIYKHKMKQSKDIKNCILYPIQWMVFSKRAMVFCWPWSTLGWTKISLFSGRQTRFSEYIEQRKALLFYLFVSNKVAKSPVSKTANKPSIYDFSVSRSMRYTEVNVTSGFVAVLDSSIIFWPFLARRVVQLYRNCEKLANNDYVLVFMNKSLPTPRPYYF